MKFSAPLFATLAALVQISSANFDVYTIASVTTVGGDVQGGWHIFEAEPDCGNDVRNAPFISDSDDVSKSTGIRCGGYGCVGNINPTQISVMEMHFTDNPLYHWTIYKDRSPEYEMFGLDGKVYGRCIPFPGDDFWCPYGVVTVQGVRKMRCLTQFTAPQINAVIRRGGRLAGPDGRNGTVATNGTVVIRSQEEKKEAIGVKGIDFKA